MAASAFAVGTARPDILLPPIAMSPDIVPPDRGNLVPRLVVMVPTKSASSPRLAANSFRVSRVPGAELIRLATVVSTYALVAACCADVGSVRLVIVALELLSMFNVPLIVTLSKVEVPVVALTLPVTSPTTAPVCVPSLLPTRLPATSPVSAPVIPAEAVKVVNAPLCCVLTPMGTPFMLPDVMVTAPVNKEEPPTDKSSLRIKSPPMFALPEELIVSALIVSI